MLGLCGPPGVGKTSIVFALGEAINAHVELISLGGMVDPSVLKGSDNSWVGSSPSLILKAMMKSGCNDSIILFDEIDKTHHTSLGVQCSLLHITPENYSN